MLNVAKATKIYANTGRLQKKVAVGLKRLTHNQIRRRAAKEFRTAIVQTLVRRKATRSIAERIGELRVETRDIWNVHVGSGLRFDISATGRIRSGVQLTPRFVGNEADFFILMSAQYGRKALPKRSGREPYVMAFLPSDVRSSYLKKKSEDYELPEYTGSNTRYADGEHVAVFTAGPIKAVEPWFRWMNVAHTMLVQRFRDMLKGV